MESMAGWARSEVAPYLRTGQPSEGQAPITPASRERRTIDPHRECIYCGLCYSACSVVGLDSNFLGPAALNRAFTLISDSRDQAAEERLRLVSGEEGLWRCHTIFDCTAVCPKGIPLTQAIQKLKRKAVASRFKRLIRLNR